MIKFSLKCTSVQTADVKSRNCFHDEKLLVGYGNLTLPSGTQSGTKSEGFHCPLSVHLYSSCGCTTKKASIFSSHSILHIETGTPPRVFSLQLFFPSSGTRSDQSGQPVAMDITNVVVEKPDFV